ncbi:MAG: hypothetical protein IJT87_01780, partial [Ruminiclostridium sp.]|nr:hypothetical protein [Ruminiclostridium sp.]
LVHYSEAELIIYRTDSGNDAPAPVKAPAAREVSSVETVVKPIERYSEAERLIYRTDSGNDAPAPVKAPDTRKASAVETVEKPIERYSDTERLIYRTESGKDAPAPVKAPDARKASTSETVEKPIGHYSETERPIYRTESGNDAPAPVKAPDTRKASTTETVEKPIERYSDTERLIYRTESGKDAAAPMKAPDTRKASTSETVEKPIEHYSEAERPIYRTESGNDTAVPLKFSDTRDIGLLVMNSYFGDGARYLSQTAERHIHRSFTLAPMIKEALLRTQSSPDTFASLTKAVKLLTSEREPGAHDRKLTERAIQLVLRRERGSTDTVREFRELDRERRTRVLAELTRLIAADKKKGGKTKASRGITDSEAAVLAALNADRAGETVKVLTGENNVLPERLARIFLPVTQFTENRSYSAFTAYLPGSAGARETGYPGNAAAVIYRTAAEKAAGSDTRREAHDAAVYRIRADRIYERAVRLYERVTARSPEAYAQVYHAPETTAPYNAAGVREGGTVRLNVYAGSVPAAGDIRVISVRTDRAGAAIRHNYRNITNIFTGAERTAAAGNPRESADTPRYYSTVLTERPTMPMYPGSAADGGDIRITAGFVIRRSAAAVNRYDIRRSALTANTYLRTNTAGGAANGEQSAPGAQAQPFTDIRYLPPRREAPEQRPSAQPSSVSAEELVSRFGNLIEGADAGLSQAGITHVSGDISRGVREAVAKVAVTEEKVAENSKLINDIRRRQTEMEEQVLRRSDIDELSESFIGKLREQLRYDRSRYSS